MKRVIGLTLVGAILLQVLVLVGMVVAANLPLWLGSEIRVQTLPIDPRSLFRGNYVRLNYDFSHIDKLQWSKELQQQSLRVGEVVYVHFQQSESGFFTPDRVSLSEPADGIFLRGRLHSNDAPYRVRYGIEAYFAPKELALQLESDLVNGGIATLKVDQTGRAAIKTIGPRS